MAWVAAAAEDMILKAARKARQRAGRGGCNIYVVVGAENIGDTVLRQYACVRAHHWGEGGGGYW